MLEEKKKITQLKAKIKGEEKEEDLEFSSESSDSEENENEISGDQRSSSGSENDMKFESPRRKPDEMETEDFEQEAVKLTFNIINDLKNEKRPDSKPHSRKGSISIQDTETGEQVNLVQLEEKLEEEEEKKTQDQPF